MHTGTMLWGALVLVGCGGSGAPGELVLREGRASRASAPVVPGASSELRFTGQEAGDRGAQPPDAVGDIFAYDLPTGWEVLAPTSLRFINLRPAGDADCECYLSLLPSDGGGLDQNINRWRGQMGLADLGADEIEALPRRNLISAEGVYVDMQGSFSGMGGEAREGWRLLGLVVPIPGQTLFVKLTGPADVVAGEVVAFGAFCDSLRPSERAAGMAAERATDAAGGLTWTAPAGWRDQGPRTMRLVSYQVGSASECYLALARGDLASNVDRWRGQMGQGPLGPAGLDGLETVAVLGQPCPLIEVSGEYRGMGGDPLPDHTLLGLMRPMAGDSLFVKMIGPRDEVAAARGEFLEFCASIREGE